MKFTKMQGAGNDFIVINNMEEKIPHSELGMWAKKLCERRFSIGADGMMVVDSPDGEADFKMFFFNSDGSVGEMCGNGARCIVCYGYEKGLSGENQCVETTAGIVYGKRIEDRFYQVRLNDISSLKLDCPIEVDGKTYSVSYVEVGNPGVPHGVVEAKNLATRDKEELKNLARKLRFHKDFYKGINVNFYDVIGENDVNELTYERGVEDFTYACGTGSGATASVLTIKNIVDGKKVKINVPGGTLYIDSEVENGRIDDLYLTGPVKIVAEGIVCDDSVEE